MKFSMLQNPQLKFTNPTTLEDGTGAIYKAHYSWDGDGE
jgi:hypothetical protein